MGSKAGGIIQQFLDYCHKTDIQFLLVVDAAYQELLQDSFPPETLLFYPRREIKQTSILGKIKLYLHCLMTIRRFKADIAFNIEEDSVSHRLTQLSGAKFKLGSNLQRNKHGYDHVLDIDYSKRSDDRKHRWYGFADVFNHLGLQVQKPSYLNLVINSIPDSFRQKLLNIGVNPDSQVIAIHASAAKDFKRWPAENFAELISLLNANGIQCILIGAGQTDQQANADIRGQLDAHYNGLSCIDLCNQLTLFELACLFTIVDAVVGNDSGPFHLAAALRKKGCVIFGPTDVALWHPLSEDTIVLKSNETCAAECTKTGCIYNNRCLKAITPDKVLESLQQLI